jgi:hypothetical protein
VVAEADFSGSTAAMSEFVGKQRPPRVVLLTECSMSDNVSVLHPDVEFIRPCNLCPHMKRITLKNIRHALETNAHIYVTRDRGQNWARGGDIPVGAQPQVSLKAFVLECHIVADATRPDMAVVETEWVQVGAEGDNSQIASFATVDYGAHWRTLVYPDHFVISPVMATYGSVTFASGSTQTLSRDQTQNRGNSGLWVSHDQMKTWQALALPSGVTPSALAVLKLTINSKVVGCSIGRSAGFAPLRMRSTKNAARRDRSDRRAAYDRKPPASTF